MPVPRKNCVVLDTSILPKHPTVADIKKFIDEELKLEMSVVKTVQLHNVKNVVYLAVQSQELASRVVAAHHLNHYMECAGKKQAIPLPIYVESDAVDVRLHDLPEEMDNLVIANHMRQYGEVISIRNDVWRDYFPGLSNGVRVVRMQLKIPIPSFITVAEEVTSVSHFSQVRTCRTCGNKSHPKMRCSEAAIKYQSQQSQKTSKPTPQPPSAVQQQNPVSEEQWPSLSQTTTAGGKTTKMKTNKNDVKRQRSVDSADSESTKQLKKPATSTSSESDSSLIVVPDTRPARIGRRLSYSHIEDEDLRRQYIEEDDRRIEELIRQGY